MAVYGADVFVEYMVKKKKTSIDYAITLGVILLFFILNFASIMFLTPIVGVSIPFCLFFGFLYGAYYLISSRNVEYEYAFTNGDFTIDKITNRKSRKRLVSFDSSKIEQIGYYAKDAEMLKNKRTDKTVFACKDPMDKDTVYVIAQTKKNGLSLITFTPSERMVDGMKMFIPRQLRNDFYSKY